LCSASSEFLFTIPPAERFVEDRSPVLDHQQLCSDDFTTPQGQPVELGHDVGNTIIGGFMYRGTALPDLTGKYIFGTWSNGFASGNGSLLVSTPPEGYDISMYPSLVAKITPYDNRMWTTQEFRIVNTPNAGECIHQRIQAGH
jgi:hypothetical protein